MTMITGYETEVPAPPLVRRSRGLLIQSVLPIPNGDTYPSDPGVSRDVRPLVGGVMFCKLSCDGLHVWQDDTCADVDLEFQETPDDDGVVFHSFLAQADEISPANWDETWVRSRVASRVDTMISAELARELLTGATSGNLSLRDSATHVVATAAAAADVMFVIEDILADFDDMAFQIHMDPATFSLLYSQRDNFTWVGDHYETYNGHTVIADAGHDGSLGPKDPDNPGGAYLSTAATARWIYASLPVYGWVGPERPVGEFSARFDRTRDTRRDVILRPALVAFDPCAVVAVKVTVPAYTVDVAGS